MKNFIERKTYLTEEEIKRLKPNPTFCKCYDEYYNFFKSNDFLYVLKELKMADDSPGEDFYFPLSYTNLVSDKLHCNLSDLNNFLVGNNDMHFYYRCLNPGTLTLVMTHKRLKMNPLLAKIVFYQEDSVEFVSKTENKNDVHKNFHTISFALDITNEIHRTIVEDIHEYLLKISEDKLNNKKTTVNIVASSMYGYEVISNEINQVEFLDDEIGMYYQDEDGEMSILEFDKVVSEILNRKNSGMIILYGEPGTGKTSYIRHVIAKNKQKYFILPPNLVSELTNPDFITFLLSYLKDGVLIVEDVEKALVSREVDYNSPVSGILNLTDGLFSDFLNLKVIFTLNVITELDKALLRPGRLSVKRKFTKLSFDKISTLNEKLNLNIDLTNNKELTLAEVFHGKPSEMKDIHEIGFKK